LKGLNGKTEEKYTQNHNRRTRQGAIATGDRGGRNKKKDDTAV